MMLQIMICNNSIILHSLYHNVVAGYCKRARGMFSHAMATVAITLPAMSQSMVYIVHNQPDGCRETN